MKPSTDRRVRGVDRGHQAATPESSPGRFNSAPRTRARRPGGGRLSESQRYVIGLLRDGYAIEGNMRLRYWKPGGNERFWRSRNYKPRVTVRTLEALEARKLVRRAPDGGFRWRLTERGAELARELTP